MKNKGTISAACILVAGLAAVLPSFIRAHHVPFSRPAPANDVAELKVTIREWAVPTKGAHPHDPAVGADGALWFTEQMKSKIGRVDPTTGEFKEYPV